MELEPVFGEERRRQILEIVRSEGRARVRDLALRAGVTETTIRKDIADLDRARLLRRIHGGALAINQSYESDVADRSDKNLPAKRAIARACIALIRDGDAIFLDSGTTTATIAEALIDPSLALDGTKLPANVNVLTNSMAVARTLAQSGNVRHNVLGGQYRPLGDCFVGSVAQQALDGFMVNTAFIGVTGVDESGITCADTAEVQVKATAMDRSRRVVVPLDSSKIGVSDFVKVTDLSSVDIIVADEATPVLERICSRADVELIVADR